MQRATLTAPVTRDTRTLRDTTQNKYTRKTRGTTVDNHPHTNARGHTNTSTRIHQEGRASQLSLSRNHARPRVHTYATQNKYINTTTSTNEHTFTTNTPTAATPRNALAVLRKTIAHDTTHEPLPSRAHISAAHAITQTKHDTRQNETKRQ